MNDNLILLKRIIDRAEKEVMYNKSPNSLLEDIKRADDKFKLRLYSWLNANKTDFAYDLIGIVENSLKDNFGGFIPKFATTY